VNVKASDIGKKLPAMKKAAVISARDSMGNLLSIDQVVKVISGPLKGYIGSIRHYDRNYLFMYNKEFNQSNGIFVESCRNVTMLGAGYTKGD
jgi:transcription elongation factor